MKAAGVPELPQPKMCRGGCAYEVKWDGWRAAAFTRDGDVFLQSRSGRSLTAYFPDVAAQMTRLPRGTVLDGELVYFDPVARRTSFSALQRRLRPVTFVAFDLLNVSDEDLREEPLRQRRARLEALLAEAETDATLQLCPQTTDYDEALLWLEAYAPLGSEGLVVKDLAGRYRRTGWWKYKLRVTAEAIVGGVGHDVLLLGRFDDDGRLRFVGRTGPLTVPQRREVAELATPIEPGDTHPWPQPLPSSWSRFDRGEPLAYQPVRPLLVAEIVVDQAYEQGQWRHQVRHLRIRTDLQPTDVARWDPDQA